MKLYLIEIVSLALISMLLGGYLGAMACKEQQDG